MKGSTGGGGLLYIYIYIYSLTTLVMLVSLAEQAVTFSLHEAQVTSVNLFQTNYGEVTNSDL